MRAQVPHHTGRKISTTLVPIKQTYIGLGSDPVDCESAGLTGYLNPPQRVPSAWHPHKITASADFAPDTREIQCTAPVKSAYWSRCSPARLLCPSSQNAEFQTFRLRYTRQWTLQSNISPDPDPTQRNATRRTCPPRARPSGPSSGTPTRCRRPTCTSPSRP